MSFACRYAVVGVGRGPDRLASVRGVQTFLPYPDFEASARALDQKRLGKQRVETIQVVRALTVPGYGWANHPAALMWRGFEEALGRYGFACCEAWIELGFGDTCAATIATDLRPAGVESVRTQPELAEAGALPPWLGDPELHRSHQSALVRKDPEFYRGRFPDVPDDLPYVWPVRSPAVVRGRAATRRERRTSRAARCRTAPRRGGTRPTAAQPGRQEGVGDASAEGTRRRLTCVA